MHDAATAGFAVGPSKVATGGSLTLDPSHPLSGSAPFLSRRFRPIFGFSEFSEHLPNWGEPGCRRWCHTVAPGHEDGLGGLCGGSGPR
jgi:hypothetical protein